MIVIIKSKLQGDDSQTIEQVNTLADFFALVDEFEPRWVLIKNRGKKISALGFHYEFIEIEVQ